MGRLKRQRQFKSCDPFSKKGNRKSNPDDDKFDKAPSKNDNHFAESGGFKKFQSFIEMSSTNERKDTKKPGENTKQKPEVKKSKIAKVVENYQQLPGESKKDMFRRLDQNIHSAMNEALCDEKVLRKKRKEHLKARDTKKKNKQTGKTPDGKQLKEFSGLTDKVKFGERVDAPPALTSAPRNAARSAGKPKILRLHSLLGEKKSSTQDKETTPNVKRRREMADGEKEKFDEERQRAIDAYRLAKKRREMKSAR